MKFIKAIFENEDIKQLAISNEKLISEVTNYVIDYNMFLEFIVTRSIAQFIVEGDLVQTYNNIVNFIISENTQIYNEVSNILSDLEISNKLEIVAESMDNAKNKKWENVKTTMMHGQDSDGTFDAAQRGILGSHAKEWADDASSQLMNGMDKSTEQNTATLKSSLVSTNEKGKPIKNKAGDSLSTNIARGHKASRNLPKNGDPC
jgi:hypothetical protein